MNAEVEPYVAVDPSSPHHIVAVWQQDRWNNGSARGLIAAYSDGGGTGWHEVPLPFGVCATGHVDEGRVTDPWVSIGPDGTVYVAAAGGGQGTRSPGTVMIGGVVFAATSADGGRHWKNATAVSANRGSVDRVSITADPTKSGVAYIVWQSEGTLPSESGTLFSKTEDGGRTWSAPVSIVPAQPGESSTSGNVIVVDPRTDTLYDTFDLSHRIAAPRRVCGVIAGRHVCRSLSVGAGAPAFGFDVSFVRSTDGGATWSEPKTIAEDLSVGWVTSISRSTVRTGATLPEPAIDSHSGAIYVVWQDSRFRVGQADDVAFSRSIDGGAHWSRPICVNVPSHGPAILPAVAVDSRGTVGVTYYQFRTAAGRSRSLPMDYWFSSSRNGAHFSFPHRIAGPFDMMVAPVSSGYFVGDYEGLAGDGQDFRAVFIGTNSHSTTNSTDVFTTAIAP